MTPPKTLLQMAGADQRPHRLAQSSLLIIDAQKQYGLGPLALPGFNAALSEAARLLEAARSLGVPVFHVQHRGQEGGAFDPASKAFEIVEPLSPRAGEQIIIKALPNAFTRTELAGRLEAAGTESLIVAGFMTHMCVSSTVRAALDHGYGCTVVSGACATRDLPDGSGGAIPAAEIHRFELAALADRFALIAADTSELLG